MKNTLAKLYSFLSICGLLILPIWSFNGQAKDSDRAPASAAITDSSILTEECLGQTTERTVPSVQPQKQQTAIKDHIFHIDREIR